MPASHDAGGVKVSNEEIVGFVNAHKLLFGLAHCQRATGHGERDQPVNSARRLAFVELPPAGRIGRRDGVIAEFASPVEAVRRASGRPEFLLPSSNWISVAQRTASTGLANSAITLSPALPNTRP